MEANYARFLTQIGKGIKWSYEPEKFTFPQGASQYGITVYVPDFKIWFGKHIHYVETKGFMDHLSIEKIRLTKRFYPWVKIYIVGIREYRLIKKHYGEIIRGWEN
jgi:hypothetical protein